MQHLLTESMSAPFMKTTFKNIVKPVINASGRMTKLGVSTQSDFVIEMMNHAAKNYYLIDDLYAQAGSYLAKLLNVNDVVITSSASAGIALSAATIICGEDNHLGQNLHTLIHDVDKRDILIPMGQNINYGAPIHLMLESGGANVVPVGSVNIVTMDDMESAISENTAALMYVKSHHAVQKNMVSLESVIKLGKKYLLPVIVDAASEEDLFKYYKKGADFVIYSGSKALCGPTSGLVLCQSKENAVLMRKHLYGVGRAMKIGKEAIFGLVGAVEEYLTNKENPIITHEHLVDACNQINTSSGITAKIIPDDQGRAIERIEVSFNEEILGLNAIEANIKLNESDPRIYVRDHQKNLGKLSIDPRPLQNVESLNYIVNKIKEMGK